MKNINTSFATTTSEQPLKSTSLNFLQQGTAEIDVALAKSILQYITGFGYDPTQTYWYNGATYSSSTPYVLYGAWEDIVSGTFSFTEGLLLYKDNLYKIPAQLIHATAGGYYGQLYTYNDPTLDPTTFSDFTTHNVHNDTYIKWYNTNPGTYSFKNSDMSFINLGFDSNISNWLNSTNNAAAVGLNWQTSISYGTGWQAAGIVATPKYAIDAMGNVQMQGWVKLNSGTGSTILTLPVGYRPQQTLWLPAYMQNSYVMNTVQVNTNGTIVCPSSLVSTGMYVDLSSIKFNVA